MTTATEDSEKEQSGTPTLELPSHPLHGQNHSFPNDDASPILDDVLIALQKSLSRISNATAQVDPEHACALISSDVDFSIELQVDNEQDRLLLNKDGAIKLSMSGKITPDIRSVSEEQTSEINGNG